MVSTNTIFNEEEERNENNAELTNNIPAVESFNTSDISEDSDISIDDRNDKNFVVSSRSEKCTSDDSDIESISNNKDSFPVPLTLSEKIMVS